MSKFVRFLMVALVLCLALTVPALAVNIGGQDETSEVNGPRWATGAPSPGVAPALTGTHLLISEFAVTGTPVEFIEIYNPTSEAVDLTDYYISDNWYEPAGAPVQAYFYIVTPGYMVTTSSDYNMRFPAGTMIMPGGVIVIAQDGLNFDATYGAGTADFELTGTSALVPDMINVGNNVPAIPPGGALLSNTAEFIMLYYWGGFLDNICDIDYVMWGTSTPDVNGRVDKTPFSVDGPDPDALATPFKADTPDAMQSPVAAPGAALSSARVLLPEGVENLNGNGCCFVPPTAVQFSTWGKIKVLFR